MRYGGNTSCVEVVGADGSLLVLDAGTGIRGLPSGLPSEVRRIDLLLTHLHMDHIQGLGFFAPLWNPDIEVHIWGPASTTNSLRGRLTRYLSPPLFPVRLRDLAQAVEMHEVPCGWIEIGGVRVRAELVCHPDPTVGYRIEDGPRTIAYLPDHEPALGVQQFPEDPSWTSGFSIAQGADLLIHDAQYSDVEYDDRFGWGHSTISQAIRFAAQAGVRQVVPFHHDPYHEDNELDRLMAEAVAQTRSAVIVTPGIEGSVFEI
jgi:phosphoribosyl 1,2-cyclic phosphodiesterase